MVENKPGDGASPSWEVVFSVYELDEPACRERLGEWGSDLVPGTKVKSVEWMRARASEGLPGVARLVMESGEAWVGRVFWLELGGRGRFERMQRVVDELVQSDDPGLKTFVGHRGDEKMGMILQKEGVVSLGEFLGRNDPMRLEELRVLVEQIGGSLVAAHGRGIDHRDLNGANILWNGRWFLIDWYNSSKVKEGADIPEGTPPFMGEERMLNPGARERVDWRRDDVKALGVLVYNLLAGGDLRHLRFVSDYDEQLFLYISGRRGSMEGEEGYEYRALKEEDSELCGGLGRGRLEMINKVLERAVQHDWQKRCDMGELVNGLMEVLAGERWWRRLFRRRRLGGWDKETEERGK